MNLVPNKFFPQQALVHSPDPNNIPHGQTILVKLSGLVFLLVE